MLTEGEIFDYLQKVEPYGDSPAPLLLFTANGEKYRLHVDVNNQEDKYGLMWEWWLEKTGDYVDGGFVPANDETELRALAALIYKAGTQWYGSAGGAGRMAD